MLERLMQQAEQAEVFEIENESTQIGFEANKLKSFQVEETRGIAARVMLDGRLGFAASSDLSAVDRLIENTLESARHGDALPLRFPLPQPGPTPQVHDPQLAALSTDRLIEIGQEIVDIVLAVEGGAHVNVNLERGARCTTLRNSAGVQVTAQKSPLTITVATERVEGDDVVLMFDYLTTTRWDEGHRDLAGRIADKLRLARRVTTLAPGRLPVLFSPTAALVLALPITEGLDGKNVYRGISPLAGRIGEQLFDQKLAVIDDPTIDGRPGSGSHDAEGVPHQQRALIDGGVLQGFIYDLKTAAQANVEPTGNGQRDLFRPPTPEFSNLVIQGGETPLAAVIAGIKKGLLVENVLGIGQGNVITGEFSNNLSLAFLIEGGEIVGRVKDVSIAGNIYQDLRQIEAVSQESQWVYGRFCLPYVLLPELNVVTKGE
ncbi:MAG: TldD/PmbA family protein [Anaerolineae bacterium]|nr:TldD/PmbA family protein [Anaerolineae bacterium]